MAENERTMPKATVIQGDCVEVMRDMADESVDAIVTDPPYGLSKPPDIIEVLRHWLNGDDGKIKVGTGFMGADWDGFVPGPATWREAWRVLKPGGYLLAFAGSRTFDLMGIAIRMAGFEIRDSVSWTYGCFDEATEVLTPGGWVRYHAVAKGSVVLGYVPETASVEWMNAEDRPLHDYEDIAFRLVGDGADQLLSRGHRCIVERNGALCGALIEYVAQELQARVPILEGLRCLPDRIPLHDPGAGDTQHDVQQPLRWAPPGRSSEGRDTSAGIQKGPLGQLRGVRQAGVETRGVAAAQPRTGALLLPAVQRCEARGGVEGVRAPGSAQRDPAGPRSRPAEDDGVKESCVARGSHDIQEEGQLQERSVRALPPGISRDGAEGRLRHGAPADRSPSNRAVPSAQRVGAPRGPQPYEQRAVELGAFSDQRCPQAVRVAGVTRTVVVRIEPEFYRGIMWCVSVPSGAIVARRNGCVFVTGNSGFPKSRNVGAALPGENGEGSKWGGWGTALKPSQEPVVVARKPLIGTVAENVRVHGVGAINIDGCRVATSDNGGAGASKPSEGRWPPNLLLSHVTPEVIDGFRCPDCGNETWTYPDGTAAGVDETFPEGTCYCCMRAIVEPTKLYAGGCKKVGTKQVRGNGHHPASRPAGSQTSGPSGHVGQEGLEERHAGVETVDAWECAEGCPVAALDAQSGTLVSGVMKGEQRGWGRHGIYGVGGTTPAISYADAGGASRFFPQLSFDPAFDGPPFCYSAKTARKEREAGCDALPIRTLARSDGAQAAENAGADEYTGGSQGIGLNHVAKLRNPHPTVKPVALCRWLIRLVTPPGGKVLDPFCGSGSMGMAALYEGVDFTGIEREPEYVEIANARIAWVAAGGKLAEKKPQKRPSKKPEAEVKGEDTLAPARKPRTRRAPVEAQPSPPATEVEPQAATPSPPDPTPVATPAVSVPARGVNAFLARLRGD